jgi:hypothetical protein
MPRRPQTNRDPVAEAHSAVQQLVGTPLEEIARRLADALEVVGSSRSRDEIPGDQLAGLTDYVKTIVRPLPRVYGDRFWFDAGLIRAMAGDWGDRSLFSPMIIPCYEDQWGYTRLPLPLAEVSRDSDQPRSHVIELIMLPGGQDLQQISLLDYPWIAHELAHSLMFRFDQRLLVQIEPPLRSMLRRRRLAAIADRGQASSPCLKTLPHRNVWA